MSETRLITPQGEYELHRYPARKRELLRAWDAADEYLLDELSGFGPDQKTILILNDSFGALAVAMHFQSPVSWSDSWLAHRALHDNLVCNGCDPASARPLPSTATPEGPLDLVLIKVPKSLALFEDQLIRLKPLLTEESRVVVGGMVKTMPSSVWQTLERIIGTTRTSLARKKARLIAVSVDHQLPLPENPYPKHWCFEGLPFEIINHANVFSRERLDIGTRFLLQHLPATRGAQEIIDLGCGNGLLGLVAAQQNPEARLHFVDESYMAIASAKANFQQLDGDLQRAEFHLGNGLAVFHKNAADVVLCNPPFHQSHALGDTLALSMFRDSARVLRDGGELWVVGNRHLGYHARLKRYFDAVELVASNRKFVVLKCGR
ncbi:MAG: methyltransferase [Xanthomonadales bacterium]|nr:methyltransferase [Xanthomonadales bacterium]